MLKDIKQIDKFKAFFKAGLSSDGDYAELKITLNTDLKKALKETTINEVENFNLYSYYSNSDEDDDLNEKSLKRYKVKRVIFSSLPNRNRECLFTKELIDKGRYTFQFNNIMDRDKFKEDFKNNLFSLLRLSINEIVEQTVTFKINSQ